jgi:hypothetical protein
MWLALVGPVMVVFSENVQTFQARVGWFAPKECSQEIGASLACSA